MVVVLPRPRVNLCTTHGSRGVNHCTPPGSMGGPEQQPHKLLEKQSENGFLGTEHPFSQDRGNSNESLWIRQHRTPVAVQPLPSLDARVLPTRGNGLEGHVYQKANVHDLLQ